MNYPLTQMADNIREGNAKRGFWPEGLSPNFKPSTALWLVVTELAEATEAERGNRYANVDRLIGRNAYNWRGKLRDFRSEFMRGVKDTFEDEIADALIRLLDFLAFYDGLAPYKDGFSKDEILVHASLFGGWESLSNSEFFLAISDLLSEASESLETETDTLRNSSSSALIAFCAIVARCWFYWEIDVFLHINMKLKFNATRPYKHGKAY